jgi:hypothetical protein
MTLRRPATGLLLVGALIVGSAVGPARLAAAVGLAPGAAAPAGFVPEATPVRVMAPSLRITDLTAILENQPISLGGGGMSPRGTALAGGTLLLRFARIDLDNLTISQKRPGLFGLTISNSGSGTTAATIGATGGTVELWGVLHSLQVCLPQTLLHSPGDAPCNDVRPLVPALAALVAGGTKLPSPIDGKNLDIDIYALKADVGGTADSLTLPTGRVTVGPG